MKRIIATSILALSASLSQVQAEDAFKIGFAVSLTGYLAPYDTPTVEGAQIAITELNATGGLAGKHRIEALVRDVRSETVQTTVVVQELIDAGAKMLVVPCDDDPAVAGGLLAQANGIPVFSTCATNAALPKTIGNFYFTNYVADTLQGATLAQEAFKAGFKRAYLLTCPDTTYTANLPEYFGAALTKLGGEVAGRGTYAFGQQDFSAEVTRIKALDPQPDVIMTSAYEPDFPAFIKQLRAAGVTSAVFGSDGIDSPTTVGLGTAADGVVFSNAGNPAASQALADFFASYEKTYSRPLTNSFAAAGYDMMKLVNDAAGRAGSIEGAALRDAIAATDAFKGVTGAISYKDRGNVALRTVALNRISNGKVTLIEAAPIDPSLIPASR
jgi:branched-chain amino acid transport system substrate-binding protein